MLRSVSRFATRPGLLLPARVTTPLFASLAAAAAAAAANTTPAYPAAPTTVPNVPLRWMSSTNKTKSNDCKYFHRTSFVHPLSQVVLEYLQARKSGWLLQQGLDRNLIINPDGSFQSQFYNNHPNQDDNETNVKMARIFTTYDRMEAKHYLVVQKGYLNERYMIQDNKASPWHANKKSVFDRIHVSVDELIHAVERLDALQREQQQQQQQKTATMTTTATTDYNN